VDTPIEDVIAKLTRKRFAPQHLQGCRWAQPSPHWYHQRTQPKFLVWSATAETVTEHV